MEYERLEFVDCIEELASLHGLEVPREDDNQTPAQLKQQQLASAQRKDDYELMAKISRFYQQQLKTSADKQLAIDYLKSRGLTGEIAKRFGIGYISDNWDGMMKQFGGNANVNQQLIDLGMAIEGDKNRPYDRFRGRIMFPISDKRGRVIGFGGRIITDGTPKYLNSPETRIYHKGQELYGLYEAKQANKNLQRLVVVEGYMDVVALAQHGVDYAVASLGTATTPEQLQTLFRTVKEVICCYDGDRAGREAAWRDACAPCAPASSARAGPCAPSCAPCASATKTRCWRRSGCPARTGSTTPRPSCATGSTWPRRHWGAPPPPSPTSNTRSWAGRRTRLANMAFA